MVYGYIRVSTNKQDVENQRFEINKFCKLNNISIDKWYEDKMSGTKSIDKRNLGSLIEVIQPDDLIVCTEISRIGRNLFMIMQFLNICMERNCKVWTIKDNYRLGDNIESKVLAFAFGLSAEIERQLIADRTKKALEKRKQDGIKLGRPQGHVCYGTNLQNSIDDIKKLIRNGTKKIEICKMYNVSRSTLYRYLWENNINY